MVQGLWALVQRSCTAVVAARLGCSAPRDPPAVLPPGFLQLPPAVAQQLGLPVVSKTVENELKLKGAILRYNKFKANVANEYLKRKLL